MDDNKQNPDQNQPKPITTPINPIPTNNEPSPVEEPQKPVYESVPVEEPTIGVENLTPEEIPPEVATAQPEDVVSQIPAEEDVPPAPPPVYEENRSKYFVIIGGVIFFFLILVLLIKMILGGKQPAKAITLTYWGLWEDPQVFSPIISQYEQKNPTVKINYQKMEPQDYRDKLVSRSKNGQGPDIFRFHNTWLPEIQDVASSIPTSVMTSEEFEKTFYKIQQTDLKVGSFYYGLPLEIDGLVLMYNDNMLKKAGIQSAPTTWDELTDDVTKLTVKDTKGTLITSGIAIGTTSNVEHFSDIFGLMLMQNGGDITKLDTPEAAGALEIYRKFAESPQAFWNDDMPDSTTAFVQEKVAMIIAPSWEILAIKNANPDISVKVVPVPAVPGSPPISIANYWVEGVSKLSKNQIEAWKFLRYLVEKDSLTKLYETESKLRPVGEPYSRVDMASLLIQDNYAGAVIKQANNFVSIPIIGRTNDNGLNDENIKYIENAINSTISGVSYAEALGTAKLGIDQVLAKYKLP